MQKKGTTGEANENEKKGETFPSVTKRENGAR
jgi:hypothetical protein